MVKVRRPGRSTRKGRQNEDVAGKTVRLQEAKIGEGDGTTCKERSRRGARGKPSGGEMFTVESERARQVNRLLAAVVKG